MIYLKWLIDASSGERIPEELALEAFSIPWLTPQEVCSILNWKFVPVAGLEKLETAVKLLAF